jgi:hypothetical protein
MHRTTGMRDQVTSEQTPLCHQRAGADLDARSLVEFGGRTSYTTQSTEGGLGKGADAMTRLPVRTKLAYGIGQVGEQIKISGFDLFVFFYFQQVLGLSGSLAGAAMAIALAFDAVTDPLLGSLSDNWQSPRGRRHPFMYAAALPLAVFWFGLFFPPAGLGQVGLFVWLTTFAILIRGSMTLYHVPHMAMGAELSEDYEERTSVVSWRITFGLLGGVLTSAVALALFFPETAQYKNGLLNPRMRPAQDSENPYSGSAACPCTPRVFLPHFKKDQRS